MGNPFELFGLEPVFEIDEKSLSETYRTLQRVAHPDRHVSESSQERRRALENAAAINDAYHTLRDPFLRARCLLELQGIETHDGIDPDFLVAHMELREQLEEVKTMANPEFMLSSIQNKLHASKADLLLGLAKSFRSGTPKDLAQAAEQVGRLRFYDRLDAELSTLETDF
ncbi:Co-chaperone protein HscB homolog [Gammaproteobacteria bacterium]